GALRRPHRVGRSARPAESRSLAERKSARGNEGGAALDANRGGQGRQDSCHQNRGVTSEDKGWGRRPQPLPISAAVSRLPSSAWPTSLACGNDGYLRIRDF